jgi:hypothetical protein
VVPFQNCVDNPPPQPRWLPLQNIENSAKNLLKIIFSESAGPIGPKLWWNGLQMVIFENYVRRSRPPTKIAAVTKIDNLAKHYLKIISSETTGPIGPKLWCNGLQVIIFKNCVRRLRLPTKMATVTTNKKSTKKSLKNYLL